MNYTFETETDEVRYSWHGDGQIIFVATYEQGIELVRQSLRDGAMSRLVIERGYYVKYAYAMSNEGYWLYKYSLIWRQVN